MSAKKFVRPEPGHYETIVMARRRDELLEKFKRSPQQVTRSEAAELDDLIESIGETVKTTDSVAEVFQRLNKQV